MKSLRYIENVSSLTLHSEKCIGCGLCVHVCPRDVMAMRNHRAVVADLDACMECGACVNNCPSGALEVKPGVG